MIGLAALAGISGYTLLYAGATGKNWENPWCPALKAFGQTCPPAHVPTGALSAAGALVGITAAVEAMKSGQSALSGVLRGVAEAFGLAAVAG